MFYIYGLLEELSGGAANITAAPGAGSIVITGFAPTVTLGALTVAPGVGSILITGFAPGVNMGIPAASTVTGAPPAGDQANAYLGGTLVSATQSPFFEFFGPFNVSAWGTFSGTISLERSFDGGVTWLVPIYAATSPATFTAPISFSMNECELGVLYRFDCTTYASGTINYRISTTGRMARSEAN